MYGNMALVYDKLMEHVDFREYYDFVLALAARGGIKDGPWRVLDLACGTGAFLVFLAEDGHRVTGVDKSAEMLAVASQKVGDQGVLLRQDMRSFVLGEPVDLVICLFDSLNYLTGDGDLEKAFRQVAEALVPGGVFVCDLHTEHKFRDVLAAQTFGEALEDVAYIWDSFYDSESRICQMDLTFFTREGDGRYSRWEETHLERCWTDEEVLAAAEAAGLSVVGTFGELTLEGPGPEESRVYWVMKKG